MFSGIVEKMGTIAKIEMEANGPGCRLVIREAKIASETNVADSVAINGCCLTVVEKNGDELGFDVGPESLARTNLGEKKVGDAVNMERALAVGDRLGGHIVSGHVDGTGVLLERKDEKEWSFFKFGISHEIAKQMVEKGSIAIDGTSLTVCEAEPDYFTVALIPFTLEVTTLGKMQPGDRVNLETDILAKYVQRLVEARAWDDGQTDLGK
ncbi:MAG: riboflavin synthase [Planctomycetia bacterium]|nr:riboflavin synthase [Planctomycetia bacterium]